ncbi:hypothetical protein [Fodinibius sp. SL11]|uniref:hypothetical protein n=1 Tax=Fodinibius sp. SL11 TaxID=3425690 RepID=UPI003F883BA1
MAEKDTLPCSEPDCDKRVTNEDILYCADCGAPTCGEHDECWCCKTLEEVEPTCEECGQLVDEWEDLQMPYCSAHGGGCYELFICDDCYEDWECPKGGQYALSFTHVGGLPF